MQYTLSTVKLNLWLVFTLLFGLLPILLRLLAFSVNPTVTPVILSDFIFLGLMFNATAVINVAAEENATKFFWLVVVWVGIFSAILACIYTLNLFIQASATPLWVITFIIIIPGLLLSVSTTDSEAVMRGQAMISQKDFIDTLPKQVQQHVNKLINRLVEQNDRGEPIDETLIDKLNELTTIESNYEKPT